MRPSDSQPTGVLTSVGVPFDENPVHRATSAPFRGVPSFPRALHWILLAGVLWCGGWSSADEADEGIGVLLRTGPQGAGSREARVAAERLSRQGPEILPKLLAAMDSRNVVGANWCRSVYERIVARALAADSSRLPKDALERFVLDANQAGRPRRLALATLEQLDPTARSRRLPLWLDDPEFRSDAVAFALQSGDLARSAGQPEAAREQYASAFRHARDSDQVLQAVARLKSVGVDMDPIVHLGLITRWHLLGPFDAPGMSGFAQRFAPEELLNLEGEYEGRNGQKLRWLPHGTPDALGQVNLVQALGAVKEAVGFAHAEVASPRQQQVQLRCSADDNLTVWLNGEKVLAREQWLNGTRFDRFMAPVTLQAGTNRILVKICQGPQHVDPEVPNNWSFQLRFCDATGGGVGLQVISPPLPTQPQDR